MHRKGLMCALHRLVRFENALSRDVAARYWAVDGIPAQPR